MDEDENFLKSGKETPNDKAEKDKFYGEFIRSQEQIRAEYKELNNLLKIALEEFNYKIYVKK
jgi:hypothetical protein